MVEQHEIEIADDERIVAIRHESDRDETGPLLVFCHGFVSDKSGSYASRANRATQEGFEAVRFDFRGCGESTGDFRDQTLRSKLADLRAVLAYFDPSSVVLFGSSFGAKVAFHLAGEDGRVVAVIGRAPVTYGEARRKPRRSRRGGCQTRTFDSMREAIERNGRVALTDDHIVDERFIADLDRYPFADAVAGIEVPVAIVHGATDDSVPLKDSLDAVEALSRRTDVWLQVFEGEGHRFS
ncbi:MAG: alpha/beta hydrolase family protein, partial [Natronomonas sp.]